MSHFGGTNETSCLGEGRHFSFKTLLTQQLRGLHDPGTAVDQSPQVVPPTVSTLSDLLCAGAADRC